MSKGLKNETGNILIIVVVVMGLVLTLIPLISSHYSNLHRQSHLYYVGRENLRIGTELGALVAQAYEYGEQLKSASQTCSTGYSLSYGSGGHFLCFQSQTATCISSPATPGTGSICLVLTGSPTVIGKTDKQPGKYELHAEWRPSKPESHKSKLFDTIFPPAEASMASDVYAPPAPSASNTVATISCTGSGDPTICHSCGVSQNYICFLIQYCPADSMNGTCGTAYTSMGVMIATSSVANIVTTTYTTSSGCPCTYTVPAYSTITVTIWGGGGGGGATCTTTTGNGAAGVQSSFGSEIGGGGGGGGWAYTLAGTAGAGGTTTATGTGTSQSYPGTAGSSSSSASGGSGGSSYTGAGGSGGADPYGAGAVGTMPGGGGGGGAGYAFSINGGAGGGGGGVLVKTYTSGQLTVGGTVTVNVGAGGAGGSCNSAGGVGGAGEVIVQSQ